MIGVRTRAGARVLYKLFFLGGAPYRRRRYGLLCALSPKAIRAFVRPIAEGDTGFCAPYRRRRYGLLCALSPKAIRAFVRPIAEGDTGFGLRLLRAGSARNTPSRQRFRLRRYALPERFLIAPLDSPASDLPARALFGAAKKHAGAIIINDLARQKPVFAVGRLKRRPFDGCGYYAKFSLL